MNKSVPIFVTRPTAEGYIFHFDINIYVAMLLCVLVVGNVAVWSCIGIYEAGRVIF